MSSYFSVAGSAAMIAKLRKDLLSEKFSENLEVSSIKPFEVRNLAAGSEQWVRGIGVNEVFEMFLVHIPAGLVAHVAYDTLKAWLKAHAGDARVEEHAPSQKSEQ